MQHDKRKLWAARLDGFCAVTAGLVPLGLVIGNVGFEATIAMTGCFWIVRSLLARWNPIPRLVKHPLIIPWLAWLGSVLVSLLWNGPGGKGWGHDVALVRYFIYVAAVFDISLRKPVFKYLLIGLGAGIVWGLANTLLAYAIGHDLFGRPLSRYSYKIKDAGRIASLAAYVGPFFLAWGSLGKDLGPLKRLAVLAIGVIAMIQIFHIQIRTVEIAAAAGMFAYIIYIAKRFGGWLIMGVATAALGLFAWLFVRFGPQVNLWSLYDRMGYWKVVWEMWREHPIVGVAVSAWQDVYKEMAASDKVAPFVSPDGRIWKAVEVTHAHNLVLHILSCTGLLGLASFGWLFVNTVRMVIGRLDICGHALLTWPVVFLVIGLTGWNIYGAQYQTVFAFFIALTGASLTQDKPADSGFGPGP